MGDCLDKRIPWMVWEAIAALDQHLRPGMRVFEWGSGGSTLFWLKHGCTVVSIDHTPGWPKKVLQRVAEKNLDRIDIRHVQASPGTCHDFASRFAPKLCFRSYVTAIDNEGTFDVVCVDGRARVACVRRAIEHVAHGGIMVLDNSDRSFYAPAVDALASLGWTCQSFSGAGPESKGRQWKTSIFRRP
jgi:tRNA A58 N-methylase Trm61